MTLEEAAANIGRAVIYRAAPDTVETGTIQSTSVSYVFVRFGSDTWNKAVAPGVLEFAAAGS
jgi:hypothetical protein